MMRMKTFTVIHFHLINTPLKAWLTWLQKMRNKIYRSSGMQIPMPSTFPWTPSAPLTILAPSYSTLHLDGPSLQDSAWAQLRLDYPAPVSPGASRM
ncbi:uncharacterized protein LOC106997166 isoform X3 [Macaca mulatta]